MELSACHHLAPSQFLKICAPLRFCERSEGKHPEQTNSPKRWVSVSLEGKRVEMYRCMQSQSY